MALFLTEVAIWGVHSTSGKPICTLRLEENENKSWNMIKFIFCYNSVPVLFTGKSNCVAEISNKFLLQSTDDIKILSFPKFSYVLLCFAFFSRADLPTFYGKIP